MSAHNVATWQKVSGSLIAKFELPSRLGQQQLDLSRVRPVEFVGELNGIFAT